MCVCVCVCVYIKASVTELSARTRNSAAARPERVTANFYYHCMVTILKLKHSRRCRLLHYTSNCTELIALKPPQFGKTTRLADKKMLISFNDHPEPVPKCSIAEEDGDTFLCILKDSRPESAKKLPTIWVERNHYSHNLVCVALNPFPTSSFQCLSFHCASKFAQTKKHIYSGTPARWTVIVTLLPREGACV